MAREPRTRTVLRRLAFFSVAALVLATSRAQTVDDRASELMRELEAAPLPRVTPPPVALEARAEVTIPGPLEGAGPIRREGAVGIRVAGGLVLVPWDGSSGLGSAVHGPIDDPPSPREAVGLSPDGRARARFLDTGHLVLETACRRCADGWNRRFRLRVVGRSAAPPLVTEHHVYYAARDNVVYCVRRDNGHRVWAHVAAGRVAPRLVLWTGRPTGTDEKADPVSLVLAVTDEPSALVALDARTGERVCAFEAGTERTVVGAPLVVEDGRVILARQDYRSTDAALVLLEAVRREATEPPPR